MDNRPPGDESPPRPVRPNPAVLIMEMVVAENAENNNDQVLDVEALRQALLSAEQREQREALAKKTRALDGKQAASERAEWPEKILAALKKNNRKNK